MRVIICPFMDNLWLFVFYFSLQNIKNEVHYMKIIFVDVKSINFM